MENNLRKTLSRPTKININLAALQNNLGVVRHYAPDSRVVCCVKANAYGHGLIESAQAMFSAGADALAVACLEEAEALRKAQIKSPILLLEGVFDQSELDAVAEMNLWMVVHSEMQLGLIENTDLQEGNHLWIKVDSGMHRLGFAPEEVPQVIKRLPEDSTIRLMTHFACAEELYNDFTAEQISTFFSIPETQTYECSLANSAGIIAWPDCHSDWVRPGFMLYGLSPLGEKHDSSSELEPVMSFETEVIAVREIAVGEGVGYNHAWRAERSTKVAVIAAGYGDGYPRNTANGCPVLIDGHQAMTIGHVAMDMMMADITDFPDVAVGSKVELWGKNLSVNRVASHSGYSPYELLTRMPLRAVREFIS